MLILDDCKKKMAAVIEHLKSELKTVRTGRANPAMLDGVSVEVYGTKMRLRDLANISAPEPRQLVISPFNPENSAAVVKGLEKADFGYSAVVDGSVVRISIPEMSKELRVEMVKLAHKKREEGKVGVRRVRRDVIELARKGKGSGGFGEDELKRLEKEIQEITDRFCKEADTLVDAKEEEISTM